MEFSKYDRKRTSKSVTSIAIDLLNVKKKEVSPASTRSSKWVADSTGLLRSVPSSRVLGCLTFEDGTDKLPQNAGKQLSIKAA